MVTLITIANDNQNIIETNYFELEHAKKGFVYLSWNAGAGRLLVPDSQELNINEMKTGKLVIVSSGKWRGRDALELLFEDYTDAPYSINIVADQTDRLLPEIDQGGGFVVSIWTKKGKQFELPAKYRIVDSLPCLKEWVEQ